MNTECNENNIDKKNVTSSYVNELPNIINNSRIKSKIKIANASTRYATPFSEYLLKDPNDSNEQILQSKDYTIHLNNNLKTQQNAENNKEKLNKSMNDKKSLQISGKNNNSAYVKRIL